MPQSSGRLFKAGDFIDQQDMGLVFLCIYMRQIIQECWRRAGIRMPRTCVSGVSREKKRWYAESARDFRDPAAALWHMVDLFMGSV